MTTAGRNDPTIIITQTPSNYIAIKGWEGADTSDSRGVIVAYLGWDESNNGSSIIGWSQVDTVTVNTEVTGTRKGTVTLNCRVLKANGTQTAIGQKLATSTDATLGNIFTIIKSDDNPASIKVSDAVSYFTSKNITITNIQDAKDNQVELTSQSLIGTGYELTTNTGDIYTTIVYGDATGDGKIDAADVNVVVKDFLGDGKKPSRAIKIAEDVQNDGIINAADMSLMINSFLGNLQGDILKTSGSQQSGGQDPSTTTTVGKDISQVFKAGDYVSYPKNYTNLKTYYASNNPNSPYGAVPTDSGWRVAYNSNGTIKLVAAGCPQRILLNDHSANKSYLLAQSNFASYVNSQYATSAVGTLLQSEIDQYSINWLEKTNSSGSVVIVIYDANFNYSEGLKYYSDGVSAGIGIEVGIRPVVTLKTGLTVAGGSGTKDDPWQLN